jgi:citrate synthase
MEVENEWKARWEIPGYVFNVLKAMPADTHPMTLLSLGILSMQRDSVFTRKYHQGMQKENYWEPMLEDSLNLTARLPTLAAFIYSLKYRDGSLISPDPSLEGAANFARMMGIAQNEFVDLTRLYLIIHSDHESGNASAHATHLVASTLSDIYYATSAAMDALAGPLHGLANQESLTWLLKVYNKFGRVPENDELAQYAIETLNSGQVIPGYGHAVLRKTDPRFTALMEFGKKYFADDDIFGLATKVYDIVPDVLKQQGKVKDPWPNVDAISGSVLYHFGLKEFDFYTVMFGVSRVLGVSANTVWARALGQPIERPKSLTTAMLEEIAVKQPA